VAHLDLDKRYLRTGWQDNRDQRRFFNEEVHNLYFLTKYYYSDHDKENEILGTYSTLVIDKKFIHVICKTWQASERCEDNIKMYLSC